MAVARRRRQGNMSNRLALIGITLVVGLLAFTVSIRSKTLRAQEQTYLMKEDTLEKQIQSEENRTDTLNEKKKYVTTKQYIEEVARDKLGLLNPDEVILKENEE